MSIKKRMTITNSRGRRFQARLLQTGDRYGLNDCLVWDEAETKPGLGGPLVEFWDLDGKYPPAFVSRYYLSSLEESWLDENGQFISHHPRWGGIRSGLNLDGGVDEWSISAENVRDVLETFSNPNAS